MGSYSCLLSTRAKWSRHTPAPPQHLTADDKRYRQLLESSRTLSLQSGFLSSVNCPVIITSDTYPSAFHSQLNDYLQALRCLDVFGLSAELHDRSFADVHNSRWSRQSNFLWHVPTMRAFNDLKGSTLPSSLRRDGCLGF